MIKFAAILTTAAIACSGASAPAKEDRASRIAALRCKRPAITCTIQQDNSWKDCIQNDSSNSNCDLNDCTQSNCNNQSDCTLNDCTQSDCEGKNCIQEDCDASEDMVTPTATPAPTVQPTQAPEATPAPTQTPEQDGNDDLSGISAYAQEVVRLVNIERANAGLAPLSMDATLSVAAQVRAQEIDSSFSHTRPDGSSCFTVLKEMGVSYRTAGENIAKGQATPARVVEGWMNSAGHRANILNGNFTTIGVGVYEDAAGTLHWTQLFIA